MALQTGLETEAASLRQLDLSCFHSDVTSTELIHWTGKVTEVVGLLVESDGPAVAVGDFVEIQTQEGRRIRCQVVGFRNGRVQSMPLDEPGGIRLGNRVIARKQAALVGVGEGLLGRVLDGFGKPIDGKGPIHSQDYYGLFSSPPSPLEREHISTPLVTGIRVIDGMLPCGNGQRIGLFGGSGVGKSTLLSTMCRNHSADISIIALIGERNREVRDFIENDLGEEGMKRAVVVVATSDQPAPLRVRACFVALAIAEYFRDQGADALLVMDSVTRLAMAQREIGLAAGEPPSQKGYTPSVFALLPKVFERAGKFKKGSITGFFTVLVEGDDFNEPICDATRGILDGHIILSRQLQDAGHYPAINVLQSISRLSSKLMEPAQAASVRKLREALSLYHQSEDLIQLGAHIEGRNPKLDASIGLKDELSRFLQQEGGLFEPKEATLNKMNALAGRLPW